MYTICQNNAGSGIIRRNASKKRKEKINEKIEKGKEAFIQLFAYPPNAD
jgi:hypothetical protein